MSELGPLEGLESHLLRAPGMSFEWLKRKEGGVSMARHRRAQQQVETFMENSMRNGFGEDKSSGISQRRKFSRKSYSCTNTD